MHPAYRWQFLVCVLSVLLASTPPTAAQPAAVNGFVTDASDDQPLPGANVMLRSESGVLKGQATDRTGAFLLSRIEPGIYTLRISYLGYETYTDTLRLTAEESRTVSVALHPDETALEEVVVEAEGRAGIARVTAGHHQVEPEDIERVPTPDVSSDLASYLTTQSGVVSSGDRGGQLYIRGGEPTQNVVKMDGIRLFKPFHVLGFYSAFPSDIIQTSDIYAGGYPSKYGGGLSSVIDIHTRTGNKQSFTGSAAVSPFISSARAEGPLVPGRISMIGSIRRSTLGVGASRYVDQPLPYTFGDAFAKVHAQTTDASRLSITGLSTFDRGRLGAASDTLTTSQVRWGNRGLGFHYIFLPSWMPMKADFYLTYGRHNSEIGPADNPTRSTSGRDFRFGLDGSFPGDWLSVDAGISFEFTRVESKLGGLYQNVHDGVSSNLPHTVLYLTPALQLGPVRAEPGLRLQFYSVRFNPYAEPRLRLQWEAGAHHIDAAAGLYQQEIIGLHDRRDATNIFTAWTFIRPRTARERDVLAGRLPRAWHGITGYRVRPTEWMELSVEGFYKRMSRLFVAKWTVFPRLTTELQSASGRAFGADLRIDISRDWFDGYVSYGLSDVRYETRPEDNSQSVRFRPPHDRRHQINLLARVSTHGFDMSLRWNYASGRPYSRAIGFDGFVFMNPPLNVYTVPDRRRVIYNQPYDGLMPAYHRLDVSIQRTFSWDRAALTIQGTVINVYNRPNIFELDIFTLRRTNQLPIVPTVGLEVILP